MNMILLLRRLGQDVCLDGLRSDDPELRQTAEARLREAPFSRILEGLRSETDPEVRGPRDRCALPR